MLARTVFISSTQNFLKILTIQQQSQRSKVIIDRSKVPVISEKDLEEQFIKGTGPGGQHVNKTNNTVYLVHKPTGLSVKVHESRNQAENRKIARDRLTIMLDNFINQENSVENQKKRIAKEKLIKKNQKRKKLMEMKEEWKKTVSERFNNKTD